LGSTEPHGPHLPLATDTILAEEACRRAAALLEARGVKACVAPAIPFTVTDFSEGFAGRVSIPREVSTAFIREAALALAAAGCAKVVLTTFHFEPGHLACARDAAAACQAKGAPVVFVDLTKRRFAERIGGEFATGSCHAGSFETSLVLAARQDLVDSKRAAGLPELQVPLPEKMRAGVKTFRECGMADAYCGAPAAATPAEGERLYAILTEILAEAAAP
jgi:creatinine amidohydrolase